MPTWTPEHEVTETELRAAIARHFPQLDVSELVHVGRGFDVDVWLTGTLAFRVPRRAMGVAALRLELAALPHLATKLPLRVPVPLHVAEPDGALAVPFYAHRFLEGLTADRAALDDDARTALAPALGRFLRALHALTPDDARAMSLQVDDFRGALAARTAKVLPHLDALAPSLPAHDVAAAHALLASPPAPFGGERRPIHGDVYARHLLLDDARALVAVLDWGDVSLGDPAVDLDVVYTFLPPHARPGFFEAYGPVDDATRDRARFLGLCRHALTLLAYATDVGDAPLAAEARVALANVVR